MEAQAATTLPIKGIGFTGGYFQLTQPATVSLSYAGGKVSIGDCVSTACSLNAGTYFVRNEAAANLTITGATILPTGSDALALANADTYIKYGRQGSTVLSGFKPGQSVSIAEVRPDFGFGGGMDGNEVRNAAQAKLFASNFFEVATRGSMMWNVNEPKQGKVDTSDGDRILSFAKANNMTTRLHNGIAAVVDGTTPSWATALFSNPTKLNAAITARFKYELSGKHWDRMDVYNEEAGDTSKNSFLSHLGVAGVAKLYNLAASYDPTMQTAVNNGDVFNGEATQEYIAYAQQLIAAGANVGDLGIEDYNDGTPVTPSSMQLGLQALNVLNRPIEITEFGASSTKNVDTILNNALRMMYGNPQGEGFINWDWIVDSSGYAADNGLYDKNLKLTAAGKMWRSMLGLDAHGTGWNTAYTATADANGNVTLAGYYGSYLVNGKAYGLHKVTPTLALHAIPEPPSLTIVLVIGVVLCAYRCR